MHSDGGADFNIASSALTFAKAFPLGLLGEDTDLLILLLQDYFLNLSLHYTVHLYFDSSKTIVDIKNSWQLLDYELTQSILAMHVFCDCDTTSKLHSVGSRTVLIFFLKNQLYENLLRIFSLPSLDRKDILQAGDKFLLLLQCGKTEKTFDEFRVHKRKCQDRLGIPSKLKFLDPLQHVQIVRYRISEETGSLGVGR